MSKNLLHILSIFYILIKRYKVVSATVLYKVISKIILSFYIFKHIIFIIQVWQQYLRNTIYLYIKIHNGVC